jgi:hypothetical protein
VSDPVKVKIPLAPFQLKAVTMAAYTLLWEPGTFVEYDAAAVRTANKKALWKMEVHDEVQYLPDGVVQIIHKMKGQK